MSDIKDYKEKNYLEQVCNFPPAFVVPDGARADVCSELLYLLLPGGASRNLIRSHASVSRLLYTWMKLFSVLGRPCGFTRWRTA